MLNFKSFIAILTLLWLAACSSNVSQVTPLQQQQIDNKFGVVVMAHGGSKSWNESVLNSVMPLQSDYEIEVAFGMANATSIQAAVDKLEAKGINKIAVIRMFVSGESWYQRTGKILGIIDGAPEKPTLTHNKSQTHGGHNMGFWQIDSDAQFAMSKQGLSEAKEMDDILLFRALQLSKNPEKEELLILAHGPSDDEENQRWIKNITDRTSEIDTEVNFHNISVQTLREDWSGKREAAEKRIKSFVNQANEQQRTAIVVPFRVQGFGPYAKVLNGLDYQANEVGLLPHPNVTKWLARQIVELQSTL